MILNDQSIALRNLFPWGGTVQKILDVDRARPFPGDHLFYGSDYGGNHSKSKFKTYAYLVADNSPSHWPTEIRKVRKRFLSDGRRMAFKRLGDPKRQTALIPFLEAADQIAGHLVVFVVHKSLKLHPLVQSDVKKWKEEFGLSGRWSAKGFRDAFRKAHFFSLLNAQWSKPYTSVTWISDQDEFVANDKKLDDAHKIAARISSLYSLHPLGVFTMNTTQIDDEERHFEDFVSIPDLAAGMLAELSSHFVSSTELSEEKRNLYTVNERIQYKSELLVDWFWYDAARLKRTCIIFDKVGDQFRVSKVETPFERTDPF